MADKRTLPAALHRGTPSSIHSQCCCGVHVRQICCKKSTPFTFREPKILSQTHTHTPDKPAERQTHTKFLVRENLIYVHKMLEDDHNHCRLYSSCAELGVRLIGGDIPPFQRFTLKCVVDS